MRRTVIAKAVVIGAVLAFAGSAGTQTLKGSVSDKPLKEKWAPSKWGAKTRPAEQSHEKSRQRQVGSGHRQAEQGGNAWQVLSPGDSGSRALGWNMCIPGTPNAGPFGENAIMYHDEFVDNRNRSESAPSSMARVTSA